MTSNAPAFPTAADRFAIALKTSFFCAPPPQAHPPPPPPPLLRARTALSKHHDHKKRWLAEPPPVIRLWEEVGLCPMRSDVSKTHCFLMKITCFIFFSAFVICCENYHLPLIASV